MALLKATAALSLWRLRRNRDRKEGSRETEMRGKSLHNSVGPPFPLIIIILSPRWNKQQNSLTLERQTPCRFDSSVTTPGPCTILSRPACHLLELFHGSGNANVNIKAFLFRENVSPMVHFLTLGQLRGVCLLSLLLRPLLTVISHSL